eukprot:378671-Rhodomonas_salina.1
MEAKTAELQSKIDEQETKIVELQEKIGQPATQQENDRLVQLITIRENRLISLQRVIDVLKPNILTITISDDLSERILASSKEDNGSELHDVVWNAIEHQNESFFKVQERDGPACFKTYKNIVGQLLKKWALHYDNDEPIDINIGALAFNTRRILNEICSVLVHFEKETDSEFEWAASYSFNEILLAWKVYYLYHLRREGLPIPEPARVQFIKERESASTWRVNPITINFTSQLPVKGKNASDTIDKLKAEFELNPDDKVCLEKLLDWRNRGFKDFLRDPGAFTCLDTGFLPPHNHKEAESNSIGIDSPFPCAPALP